MECVMITHLRHEVAEVDPITEEHFECRAGLSTEYQLLRILEAIQDGLVQSS